MKQPKPETIERFHELLQPGYRLSYGGYRKAWAPTEYTEVGYMRGNPAAPPLTVRQAMKRIFREFGQAEQVRLNAWLTRRILAQHAAEQVIEPHMTLSDNYYELPYVPDCPECGSHLDKFGECHTCMLDEYLQEEAA